ncbi:MAG: HEPN domain-containing protein [Acidobacteria bacterium]|nr:HEPN domain-containing protein [Acidobacteriota bacterium]
MAALARHRLNRAREALREGNALLDAGAPRGAVSRFYYAALHAARALLAIRSVDSARHSGVITLFQVHFVKTGLIDQHIGRAFPRAFEKRLNTDYADFSEVTSDEAMLVRTSVSQFVEACAELLEGLLVEASGGSPIEPAAGREGEEPRR